MLLALATNYSPDRRPLSEYGYHLARGLRASAQSDDLLVLSGRFPTQGTPGVARVWDNGSTHIPLQIVRALKQHRADALLLNTHFTMWGSNHANLAGLMTPFVARRAGFKVATLLHHLPHTIDPRRVGYRLTPIHRLGIELSCRGVAASDVVCFTLKRDMDVFAKRYRARRTLHVPHGVLGERLWRTSPRMRRVLAFGHWGRGKDPEPLLRVFDRNPPFSARLVIAGGSSHTRPGFQERLAAKYHSDKITFTGYVLEASVADLFHSADLVVMPYNENTGASGVLFQTCQYGRVPLLKRLPVFEEMVSDLGLAAHFYDDDADLASQIQSLLEDLDRLATEGQHNFDAVRAWSIDRIGPIYWALFNDGD